MSKQANKKVKQKTLDRERLNEKVKNIFFFHAFLATDTGSISHDVTKVVL